MPGCYKMTEKVYVTTYIRNIATSNTNTQTRRDTARSDEASKYTAQLF